MEDRIDLANHWADVQGAMCVSLGHARKQLHKGSAGDASELDWANWLRAYLPSRYCVLKDATVIDSTGARTDQLDLVIYDGHFTPCIWQHGEKVWVPAESVYAVVECKAGLDKNNLEAAGRKVASVRRLSRTSAPFHDNSLGAQAPVAPKPILGILLADRSDWAVPLGDPLLQAAVAAEADERVELLCGVNDVAASVSWCPCGTPSIRQVSGKFALIGFFSELLLHLRRIGTVAAIDYDAYMSSLDWQETKLEPETEA